MSVYEYVALDEKGRERKGFVDATGVSAAHSSVKGIYPVEIYPAGEKQSFFAMEISFPRRFRRKFHVYRQLSTLWARVFPWFPLFRFAPD